MHRRVTVAHQHKKKAEFDLLKFQINLPLVVFRNTIFLWLFKYLVLLSMAGVLGLEMSYSLLPILLDALEEEMYCLFVLTSLSIRR